ncbi:flagellar basal body rod protein [Cytobacillus sp. Hz8]|uniref:lmo0954 family membrane protein n=1 Tax=Cytobacillus sp. Hz8 TaxID=3347168 RepID=UPI0035DEE5AC
MKKFGLLLVGGIAALVLISHLGPMIGLVISLGLAYFALRGFLRARTTGAKVAWGIFGFIALMASASNVPAILGVAAAYVLYLVYKKWNSRKTIMTKESNDPFDNFERQWSEINKHY